MRDIEPLRYGAPGGYRRRDIFGSLHAFRRQLISPGQNHRDRKTEDDKDDDEAHAPGSGFPGPERWRWRFGSMSQADNGVGRGDAENISPAQFAEKILGFILLRGNVPPWNA